MMGARLLCATLQIKNPRAVAKACEYERLADVRSQGSLGAYEPMKPAVCVELGCRHAGVSVVRASLCKTASCSEKAYSAAFRTIANLLGATVGSTMAELGVKFGVMSIVPRAEKSLEEFQKRVFARDRTQAVGPVFVAAAIYQTAKKMRLKVDRERLVKSEDLDDALFGRAIELMLLVAFDLFAGDKDVKPKGDESDDDGDKNKSVKHESSSGQAPPSSAHGGKNSSAKSAAAGSSAAAAPRATLVSPDAAAGGGGAAPGKGNNREGAGAQTPPEVATEDRLVDLVPATERKRPREGNASQSSDFAAKPSAPSSKRVAHEDHHPRNNTGHDDGDGLGDDDDDDDDGSGSSGLGAARAEGLPLPVKKLSKAEEFAQWKRKILEEAKAKKFASLENGAPTAPVPAPALKQASLTSFFQRPPQS